MFAVDQCKHFKDSICKKCGRMMPDVCHEQEIIEEKARVFDQMVEEGKAEPVTVVAPKKRRKRAEAAPEAEAE